MSQSTISPPPARQTWLQRKPILTFLRKRYKKWRTRHQHPVNFVLHVIGIPLAPLGCFVLLCCGEWFWALGAFIVGYLLQFIGHKIEGNDLGEWAAIKRLLGLPYVAISPRWQTQELSKNGDS